VVAGAHHGVLDRDTAKAHEKLCVLLQYGRGRRAIEELAHRPNDVRYDHRLRAVAVCVLPTNVSAKTIEKTMQLTLRVVKSSSAAPSIRAAIDRLPAVF
jgi:hypothetical protein